MLSLSIVSGRRILSRRGTFTPLASMWAVAPGWLCIGASRAASAAAAGRCAAATAAGRPRPAAGQGAHDGRRPCGRSASAPVPHLPPCSFFGEDCLVLKML